MIGFESIKMNGIEISKKGLKIGSRQLFLISGEVDYFRIKRENWTKVLILAKELGVNCISTKIPWNFHEVEEGNFDFSNDEHDLDQFLHECEDRGFFIIIKAGPYCGKDLINGGIPHWLFMEHPKVLAMNENYEHPSSEPKQKPPMCYVSQTYYKYIENYLLNLSKVLRRHLYPNGGIILIQLDEELRYEGHEGLYETDYNPMHIDFYSKFLEKRYGKVKFLNNKYGINFLSFYTLNPPDSASFKDAEISLNEFKQIGEFKRIMEWLESKEAAIQEFISQLCYFYRKLNIRIPYYVNIVSNSCFTDARGIFKCYKTNVGIFQSFSMKEFSKYLEKGYANEYMAILAETVRASVQEIALFADIRLFFPYAEFKEEYINLILKLAIANGIKGLNINMIAGGSNPDGKYKNLEFNYSGYESTIGFNGENHFIDNSGKSFDCKAPIGQLLQKNTSFSSISHIIKYIEQNHKNLLKFSKIYDKICIIYYYPYTRVQFNTKKLGSKYNYHKYSNLLEEPLISFIKCIYSMGIQPEFKNLEIVSVNELNKYDIIFIPFMNFIDKPSAEKLKHYVSEGGTLISLMDIPTKNEKLDSDNTLLEIYKAIFVDLHHDNEIYLFNQRILFMDTLEDNSSEDITSTSSTQKYLEQMTFNFIQHDLNMEIFRTIGEFSKFIEKPKEEDIIAYSIQKEEPSKKYYTGFKRRYGKGRIYHLGFIPQYKKNGIKILQTLFKGIEYDLKEKLNTIIISDPTLIQKNQELPDYPYSNHNPIAVRQQSNEGEELITIANLENFDFDNVSIELRNVINSFDQNLKEVYKINNIYLPKHSAINFTFNRHINKFFSIRFSSSEINSIQTKMQEETQEIIIKGVNFKANLIKNNYSEVHFRLPIKQLIYNGKNVLGKLKRPKYKNIIQLSEHILSNSIKYQILKIKYQDSLNLELRLGEEKNPKYIVRIHFKGVSYF
ncbi:MAG: beta-galactosidase [Promethearchaeota archaeon]